jgi:hypothetical protein
VHTRADGDSRKQALQKVDNPFPKDQAWKRSHLSAISLRDGCRCGALILEAGEPVDIPQTPNCHPRKAEEVGFK